MKTIVYVDGFNLYKARLRGTSYKWLNLYDLFHDLAIRQTNTAELLHINFYTAPIKAKFSKHQESAERAQDQYNKALLARKEKKVNIIKGFYSVDENHRMRSSANPDEFTEVIKLEEKQTDVNIALGIYHDAIHYNCEQIILCSGDSDIQPALQKVRDMRPDIKIGVVFPSSKVKCGNLQKLADWTINEIPRDLLEKNQFPQRVSTGKKPAIKPDHWE